MTTQSLHNVFRTTFIGAHRQPDNMGKRAAEALETEASPLKAGERPLKQDKGDEAGDFEDEFEDEFDSEDEIMEAGVDGRPDQEREVEKKRGTWLTLETLCDSVHSCCPA